MEALSNVAYAAYNMTPVITAAVGLIVAVISCMVIPYVKSKLTAEQLAQLSHWVQIAVAAAEQFIKKQGAGAEKKQYVLGFLQTKGYRLDDAKVNAEVNVLMENAVFELNNDPNRINIACKPNKDAKPQNSAQ